MRCTLSVFVTAILFASGCGGRLPETSDPAKATEALSRALRAWQNGDPLESLHKQAPPIYFNDPKADKGLRLIDFKIGESPRIHGSDVRIAAKLSLSRPDGSARETNAGYLVSTGKAIVIVPD